MDHIPIILAVILGMAAAYFLLIGNTEIGFLLVAVASVSFLFKFRMESKRRNVVRENRRLQDQNDEAINEHADLNG